MLPGRWEQPQHVWEESESRLTVTLLLSLLTLKVGHEPMPPTLGTNVLGRKVLYLPSFFTYGECHRPAQPWEPAPGASASSKEGPAAGHKLALEP